MWIRDGIDYVRMSKRKDMLMEMAIKKDDE